MGSRNAGDRWWCSLSNQASVDCQKVFKHVSIRNGAGKLQHRFLIEPKLVPADEGKSFHANFLEGRRHPERTWVGPGPSKLQDRIRVICRDIHAGPIWHASRLDSDICVHPEQREPGVLRCKIWKFCRKSKIAPHCCWLTCESLVDRGCVSRDGGCHHLVFLFFRFRVPCPRANFREEQQWPNATCQRCAGIRGDAVEQQVLK